MKITFIGAGSTIFAKNVLGDCLLADELPKFELPFSTSIRNAWKNRML